MGRQDLTVDLERQTDRITSIICLDKAIDKASSKGCGNPVEETCFLGQTLGLLGLGLKVRLRIRRVGGLRTGKEQRKQRKEPGKSPRPVRASGGRGWRGRALETRMRSVEDLLKAVTGEPQQVLEQRVLESAVGEGRQILLLLGGEARGGKALSREVVPLPGPPPPPCSPAPSAALPGTPASHHPPLKIYLSPADPC